MFVLTVSLNDQVSTQRVTFTLIPLQLLLLRQVTVGTSPTHRDPLFTLSADVRNPLYYRSPFIFAFPADVRVWGDTLATLILGI